MITAITEDVAIESELLTLGADPLIAGVCSSNRVEEFSAGIRQQVAECEAQGGYVDDIKVSTAGSGPSSIQYTALMMCRMPKEEDES